MEDTVAIDVGGTIFRLSRECILRHSGTKLHDVLSEIPPESGGCRSVTTFFNRDPTFFHYIANYYRTSELHLPTHMCGISIRKEMEFWKISETAISSCCWRPLFLTDQDEDVDRNLSDKLEVEDIKADGASSFKQMQYKLWLLLDKPNSSRGAKVWNTFLLATIMVSALVVILESTPSLRVWRQDIADMYNETLVRARSISPKLVSLIFTTPYLPLTIVDIICLAIFTIELTLHFVTCPRKNKFFKQFINWIDFIAVLSGICIVCVELGYTNGIFPESFEGVYVYLVMKIAYSCRLLKLFRLAERLIGLKVMLLSVWHSRNELLLLIFSFVILAAIFGSTQFFCEFANNDFQSIPTAIWWAVVTMTTVGYGDYYPKTTLGYVVGSVCSLVGVLLLSMPVAVIAANFNEYYTRCQHRGTRKEKLKGTSLAKIGTKMAPVNQVFKSEPK